MGCTRRFVTSRPEGRAGLVPANPKFAVTLEVRIVFDEPGIGRKKGRRHKTLFVLWRRVFQIEQGAFFEIEKR